MRTIYYGGEHWKLHDDGRIERPDFGGPSASWRVVGAVERNNFGNAVKHYTLADILRAPDAIPWTFKNGSQRVHVVDYDHGTRREWGCPRHRVF